MPVLASALLQTVAGVRHGFFDRHGELPPGVLRALGAGGSDLAMLRQVHSARVVEVTAADLGRCQDQEGDALWTAEAGLAVAVRTADCVPMLVTTCDGSIALAVHGGWRGLAGGIIEAAASTLAARGIAGDRLLVAIGPHIGPCCYRVGEEVLAALGPGSRVERGGALYADLGAVATGRWLQVGVPASQIDRVDPCTACHPDRFHSYRRDGGGNGRQLSAIVRAP